MSKVTTMPRPSSALRDWAAELNEDALFCNAPGDDPHVFDDALIGMAGRCSKPWLPVYDIDKYIEILMRDSGMDYDTAEEYFEFNVIGAWAGENTPLFLRRPPDEEGQS